MLNMGVPSFNLATSVNLIIAQRLGPAAVRRLCKTEPDGYPPRDPFAQRGFYGSKMLEDANFKIYKAVGCPKCAFGGIQGQRRNI